MNSIELQIITTIRWHKNNFNITAWVKVILIYAGMLIMIFMKAVWRVQWVSCVCVLETCPNILTSSQFFYEKSQNLFFLAIWGCLPQTTHIATCLFGLLFASVRIIQFWLMTSRHSIPLRLKAQHTWLKTLIQLELEILFLDVRWHTLR